MAALILGSSRAWNGGSSPSGLHSPENGRATLDRLSTPNPRRAGRSHFAVTRLYPKPPNEIKLGLRYFVPNVCPTRAHLRSLWSTSDEDDGVRSILPVKRLRTLRRTGV